jgi:flagellar biosynthesis GTPase FlhF
MTEIEGNHLALVAEGRAGPDVIIGDHQPKEGNCPPQMEMNMSAIVLSRKANLVHGAVIGYVKPLLAGDSLLDLTSAFTGINHSNFVSSRPTIAGAIAEKLNGKLASGKALDGLPAFLAAFDAMNPAEDEEENDDDKRKREEEEKKAKDKRAKDAEEEEKREEEEKKAKDKRAKDAEEEEENRKEKAMDAAIQKSTEAAAKAAEDHVIARFKERDAARELVESAFGKFQAFDSAEEYYRAGLKALNVAGTDELPVAALKTTFAAVAKIAKESAPRVNPVNQAMDASANKAYNERFPHANRLMK